MQPCKYEKIGREATSLAIKPGFAAHLEEENAKVDLWTDVKLQNPGFATTFKLLPGAVDIKVDAGKISRLAIKPDLKDYKANLEILPLENATFKFGISKKIDQIKSNVNLEYFSATNEGKITISPKFEVKDVKIDGQFTFNGIKENQPPVLVDHLKANYKNIALCSCYNLKEKEARGAVFLNLKKAKVGTLLHFGEKCTLKDADIFAKTKIKGVKIGTITTVFAQKCRLNLETKCKECGAKFGLTSCFTKDAINFAAGVQAPVKCANLKVVFNGDYKEAFNANINAQLKFPIKSVGNAVAGVCLTDLRETRKLGYNFEIALKQ
jgi:hypothetical protein